MQRGQQDNHKFDTSNQDVRYFVEGRILHPLPPKPPPHMQNRRGSTRSTTSHDFRQLSPVSTNRIKDDTSATSKPQPVAENSNGAVAKSSAAIAPMRGEGDNPQHRDSNPQQKINSPLMQASQTHDPRLRGRAEANSVAVPYNATSSAVIYPQHTVFEGKYILASLLDNVQIRISQDYQNQYEIHQRNLSAYRKDSELRHANAQRNYQKLQDKFIEVEKRRSEEKGAFETEIKNLAKRLNKSKASYAADLDERNARIAQLEMDKSVLAQQLKQSCVERNAVVGKLQEENKNREIQYQKLSTSLEIFKDSEMAEVRLEQAKSSSLALQQKYDKDLQHWKFEKEQMANRLKEEKISRHGLYTAMRLGLRDDKDTAKLAEEERHERKRMRLV